MNRVDTKYARAVQTSVLAYAPMLHAMSIPACVVVGTDHRFEVANAAFQTLLMHEAPTVGAPLGEVVLPEARAMVIAALNTVRATSTTQRREGVTLWQDGHPQRMVDLVFSPFHDPSQQGMCVLVQVFEYAPQSQATGCADHVSATECVGHYQSLLSHFPEGALFLFDRDLRYLVARGAGLGEAGSAKFEGKTIQEIWPAEIAERDIPYLEAALAGEASVVEVAHGNGTFEVRTLPIRNADGSITHGMVVSQDVTERKRIETALRDSEERFRQIAETIQEIFWLHDIETNKILYISPAYEAITGRKRDALMSGTESLFMQIHPDDRARVAAAGANHVKTFDEAFRIYRSNGQIGWLHARLFPIVDDDGVVRRVTGIAEDITQRKFAEEELRQRALYDPLTELPNRTLLFDRLERLNARSRRYPNLLSALLFLDLDDFKSINDTQGHLSGDQFLVDVARSLERCVRPGDTVARLGGDEFVIILDALESPEAAQTIAQRVIDALAEVGVDGTQHTGVSIGIAMSSDGTEPTTFLHHADIAMYMAKEGGRGRFNVFVPELHANEVGSSRLDPPTR